MNKFLWLKKFSLRHSICTGFFSVVMFIILFTAFQNIVYKSVYKDNTVLTITATGEKCEAALADNVRINEIYVNNVRYDLSQAELKDGWKYNGIDHFLYVYNTHESAAISIPLENVRTIDITYVKEVGSGLFDISIDDKLFRAIDGYENTKWDNDTVSYKVSPLIRPYTSYYTMLALFLFFFVSAGIVRPKNERYQQIFRYIEFADINFILSFVLYIMISVIQRESIADTLTWTAAYTDNFTEGFCIIALINMALAVLLKKNHRSLICLSAIFAILLTVNYFKLQFRDTPLMPWDFFLAGVAATVVTKFQLTPSAAFAGGIILLIVLAVLIYIFFGKRDTFSPSTPSRIVIFAAASALLTNYFAFTVFTTGVNLFEAKEYYLEKGFVSAFSESAQYLKPMDKPENYSSDTMKKIHDKINACPEGGSGIQANIIVLMSESFWDMERVSELGIKEEMLPTYRNMQSTAVTGELLTNVFGGGTVNSEFEALTGFSVSYLPTEYMPYQRCMRPDFFSINSYLESRGYESLAIHPFEKTNYNRNTAYKYFDFDKTLWEEDFPDEADRMRGYISDHALVNRIIDEYEKHNSESDAPWFNLSVSMQNHGGYWESSIDDDVSYDIDVSRFTESSQGSIRDMAIGLHYADMALGELIDYFSNEEEPTVIIMFGDHMSDAGPVGETLLNQSELLGEDNSGLSAGKSAEGKTEYGILEQRRVPFIAWNNFENVKKDCGIVSVPQLLPTVLSEYDLSMPKYFRYLKDSQSIYAACGSGIVVNKEGIPSFTENMTDEEKALYNENQLIEYDYLFGNNYLGDLFDY